MNKDKEEIEFGIIDFGPVNDTTKNIIKVVGVGGGGCNAVGNMFREGMNSATFAVCNTDSKSLSANPVPTKILLGTSGLGAGADPEKGRQEAENNIEDLKKLFSDNTKMAFITAAMGGGTGTGAGPLVAKVAREMGMLTIGIVTIPFYFERKPKIVKALKGLDEMRNNVDALLIINNEQISKVYSDSHIRIGEALRLADVVMGNAVRSICELITLPGTIQTDFSDVTTTLRNGGGAIMAIGRASGEHRVQNAILNALNSPLLYGNDISKATRILFNIYTSKDNQLFVDEIEEIDAFMDLLNPNIELIWGMATDETLDEDAKITILATGFDNTLPATTKDANQKDDYDEIIDNLYGKRPNRNQNNPLIITGQIQDDGNKPKETENEGTEVTTVDIVEQDNQVSKGENEITTETSLNMITDDDNNEGNDINEVSEESHSPEDVAPDEPQVNPDGSGNVPIRPVKETDPSKSFFNQVLRNIGKKIKKGLEEAMSPEEED